MNFKVASLVLAVAILSPIPKASAGLLSPLLGLARGSIENRITAQCLTLTTQRKDALMDVMRPPCNSLAKPLTDCLIEETERSGQTIRVFKELLTNEFGDASELVVKRCMAATFKLPRTSFDAIPVRQLVDNLKIPEKK
jgi:hypothetical protein